MYKIKLVTMLINKIFKIILNYNTKDLDWFLLLLKTKCKVVLCLQKKK